MIIGLLASLGPKTTIGRRLYARLKTDRPQLVMLDGDTLWTLVADRYGQAVAKRTMLIQRFQCPTELRPEQDLGVTVAALYSHPILLEWNRANFAEYHEMYLHPSLERPYERAPRELYAQPFRGLCG